MSDTTSDEWDLNEALRGVRIAIAKLGQIGDRGTPGLCAALVGAQPQLREVEAQMRDAQRLAEVES